MDDRLPPLTALRAFDAAARHMSFAKAAEELGVTPAALSFQIKSLEEHLGQPVFRRLNRAVELTEAGRVLAPGAAEGFAALLAAWRGARRLGETRRLTVTAGPAFTAKWLAPRLFAFVQAHPDIELRFTASLRLLDFDRDEVDVAIRFGTGADEAGLAAVPLIGEWAMPMLSPALAAKVQTADDLRRVPLLHQDDTAFLRPRSDWPAWFRAARLAPPPEGGPRFSQADHAIDAALAGGGAVLGRISLAEGALREGLLVAPFPLGLTLAGQYRFICPETARDRPQVARFRDWLLSEVKSLEEFRRGRTIVDPPA
ncbi:transcriptional regulator [Maritimibacter sp. 55A14]|uniref:transcriptional regulator GcvA n=1 Tax=Maritimibacter sp. 55A14 TaxID=2174844 RepID=UPI000D6063CB|nr:transcriptional regulator GcvA [Maritimibacter sp. 55A14]PWE32468.1 transcriptional regulator [Maritimibacter sp. 55A14]